MQDRQDGRIRDEGEALLWKDSHEAGALGFYSSW